MRESDPITGRFTSVDPITVKYPELTPYQYASNTPIQAIDLDGLEAAGVGCGCSMSQLQSPEAMQQTGKAMIGVAKGAAISAKNTVVGLWHIATDPKQTLNNIWQAVSDPVKTWQGIKSSISQWGNNLMSSNPNTAGKAVGSGLEFVAEFFIPIKGLQSLKSSSSILYEGNKIISGAIKDGVQVIVAKSADDLKYLDAMGAKALYMGEEGTKGSILVSEGASRSQILEEAVHHQQRMQYGDKFFYSNQAKLEVEAQDKLLKIGKKEKWATSELEEIQRAKETWQKKLPNNN